MKKLIVVFGSSGGQGGSVAKALSQVPGITVRAVTRNPRKASIQELAKLGCEIATADLDNPSSLDTVMQNAYGVFLMTATQLNDIVSGSSREISQGKNAASAAKKANVQHLIFSSQRSVIDAIGLQCNQYDCKADIANFITQLKIPCTFVSPPVFYQDLYGFLRPRRVADGSFLLYIPIGIASVDIISVTDMGPIIASIFQKKELFLGRTIGISGDKLGVNEICQTLNSHLAPHIFKDTQISPQQYRQLGFAGCKDLANMFDFIVRVDQRRNVQQTKQIYPYTETLDQWVQRNKGNVLRYLLTDETNGL